MTVEALMRVGWALQRKCCEFFRTSPAKTAFADLLDQNRRRANRADVQGAAARSVLRNELPNFRRGEGDGVMHAENRALRWLAVRRHARRDIDGNDESGHRRFGVS